MEFHLRRLSPCGCDTTSLCHDDFDCLRSEICTDGLCIETPTSELPCVDSANEFDGGDNSDEQAPGTFDAPSVPVDNTNEPPQAECETDCDCDFSAGKRCIDGVCQL